MSRITILGLGVLLALPIAGLVIWSILADAEMLVSSGGWWMLLAFLVTPAAILTFNFGPSVLRKLRDDKAVRRATRK